MPNKSFLKKMQLKQEKKKNQIKKVKKKKKTKTFQIKYIKESNDKIIKYLKHLLKVINNKTEENRRYNIFKTIESISQIPSAQSFYKLLYLGPNDIKIFIESYLNGKTKVDKNFTIDLIPNKEVVDKMSRPELQKLAKQNGIPGNLKTNLLKK